MTKTLGDLAAAYAAAKEQADELWEVDAADFDEEASAQASYKENEAKDELLELVLRLHREGLL